MKTMKFVDLNEREKKVLSAALRNWSRTCREAALAFSRKEPAAPVDNLTVAEAVREEDTAAELLRQVENFEVTGG